ncbi:hypothetical protein BV20DRAFT_916297, partial [Pilatotrama ljubarskyi]
TYTSDYARREIRLRGLLRQSMQEKLVLLTGDTKASMRWTVEGYHKKIYTEYGLELVGWPDDFVFTNLSDRELTGYVRISTLYSLWKSGNMTFLPVMLDVHARAARHAAEVTPGKKNRGIRPRLGRSDLKKHRGSRKVDPSKFPPRYVRNGPKSDKWVSDEAEARA